MNSIEALHEYIRLTHPESTTDLTPPLQPEGIWSLDVDLADKRLAIQWGPTSGFGVSNTSNENFAEGPDEVFASLEQVQRRVDQLLTTIEQTSPPIALLLSRLRERRGLTQRELADRLGVRQATISGVERRDDVQLSTLRRVIDALGGVLEVFASFPDARYRIEGPWCEAPHRRFTVGRVEPRPIKRGGTPFDAAFESLQKTGALPRAHEIASTISARHAVIEIP
jgi:transcriptional regulator with XRE-family HTH domain